MASDETKVTTCSQCGDSSRPVVAWFQVTWDDERLEPVPHCEPCADAFTRQFPDADWRQALAEGQARTMSSGVSGRWV